MGSSAISCSIFLQPRLLAVRQICIVLWLSLLGVKKKKNWQNQVKYQLNTSVYNKKRGNSYLWLPLPGVMAVCIFKVLARPRVRVCVPLAFCLCHGDGLFPSYVAQGGFKAGLSARLLRWLDPGKLFCEGTILLWSSLVSSPLIWSKV